ncbi:hypothetical protein GCM10020256_15140 [Streptomyces thermocoprophilus]
MPEATTACEKPAGGDRWGGLIRRAVTRPPDGRTVRGAGRRVLLRAAGCLPRVRVGLLCCARVGVLPCVRGGVPPGARAGEPLGLRAGGPLGLRVGGLPVVQALVQLLRDDPPLHLARPLVHPWCPHLPVEVFQEVALLEGAGAVELDGRVDDVLGGLGG